MSQAFALPSLPSVAGQEVPPFPAWKQSQAGNHGYDAAFQSGLGYDSEAPFATTQGLNDPVGTVSTTPSYGTYPITTIQVAGFPCAPPSAQVGFDAAKRVNPFELVPTHPRTKSRGEFAKLNADIAMNGVKEPISYIERSGQRQPSPSADG